MKQQSKTKYVHEGNYVAEVDVVLTEEAGEWSPCMSTEEAYKLDDVREALRRNDLKAAAQYGRIYELHPVMQQ